jgi:hypothetical protein
MLVGGYWILPLWSNGIIVYPDSGLSEEASGLAVVKLLVAFYFLLFVYGSLG